MSNGSNIRILLVDDHPVVREGVAAMINDEPDMTVVAQVASDMEAMEVIAQHDIDVALIDLRLEESSGLKLISQMSSSAPDIAPLVFSMHDDTQFAERAVRAGAKGYVMKHEPTATVLKAIRVVRDGQIYVRPELAPTIMKRCFGKGHAATASELDELSNREIEVLHLMADGLNRREIATELGLSIKTIESYRENLKKKLQLRDTVQLAQYAARVLGSGSI